MMTWMDWSIMGVGALAFVIGAAMVIDDILRWK